MTSLDDLRDEAAWWRGYADESRSAGDEDDARDADGRADDADDRAAHLEPDGDWATDTDEA